MRTAREQRGVGYVEVLIAAALIAVALVPGLDALGGGARASHALLAEGALRLRLESCLEEVLAQPPSVLAAAAADDALADALAAAIPGTPGCVVTLEGWDGDDADGDGNPLTGVDAGLVHVEVGVAGETRRLHGLVAP